LTKKSKDIYCSTNYLKIFSLINGVDDQGRTPLMVAIKVQNIYAIRYLIGKSASLSRQDCKGNNAYHYAATSKKEIVQVMLNDVLV